MRMCVCEFVFGFVRAPCFGGAEWEAILPPKTRACIVSEESRGVEARGYFHYSDIFAATSRRIQRKSSSAAATWKRIPFLSDFGSVLLICADIELTAWWPGCISKRACLMGNPLCWMGLDETQGTPPHE